MNYEPKEIALKNGITCVIRRAEVVDAEQLICYQKITSGETPYLVVEPKEICWEQEEQEKRIERWNTASDRLRLLAEMDGELAGAAIVYASGVQNRLRHRCSVDITLYQKFCGMGIGSLLLKELLVSAGGAGYEQAELEVVTTNVPAIALYRKLGFEVMGTIPRAMKYRDGSYADFLLMTKSLL